MRVRFPQGVQNDRRRNQRAFGETTVWTPPSRAPHAGRKSSSRSGYSGMWWWQHHQAHPGPRSPWQPKQVVPFLTVFRLPFGDLCRQSRRHSTIPCGSTYNDNHPPSTATAVLFSYPSFDNLSTLLRWRFGGAAFFVLSLSALSSYLIAAIWQIRKCFVYLQV